MIPWRALVLVWLVGVAVSTSITAVRVFRFQRLLNDAKPAESSVDAEIAKLAARMGLKRRPRAVMVEGRLAPLLWAVGRDPRLVLPRTLWERLTDRQRTLLLATELAHWKRGDHRVRYLELLATAAYWWLPVHWLMKDRFDSFAFIGRVHAPLLVIHGDQDHVIPIAEGQKLFAAANEPKQMVVVPGGTHGTIFSPDTWALEMRFFDQRMAD